MVEKQESAKKYGNLHSKHTATLDELDKYKLLVESVQDYAIFLMDPTGHIQTWNKGAEKNKGYKAEDIIGKHFSNFYQEEDKLAKKPERELELATQFGRTEDEDWRVRKDGSRFWASVVITALHDNEGNLVGFAKVTRDLTERKLHEDELRKANSLLRAQQHELEALNQAKDEFISLASHQLRTPATAVKQLLGLFIEGFEKDIAENHLDILRRAYDSNERQISIVNSLLKVAQVDSGKVILRMTKLNVAKLIASVIDDFEGSIKAKNQSINFTCKIQYPFISGDSRHIRMALENLISNASKYTYDHGTIHIKVTSQNDMLKISIADNGVGIAKQDIPLLFEKFRRIPNDLSDEVGGTGLGLYWAKRVISLHGGRIDVESAINEGTTFNIFLPMESPNA